MKTSKLLYQWDVNQSFIDCAGSSVDYTINGEVYRIEVIDRTAIIPDELLQEAGDHICYLNMIDGTRTEIRFTVKARPMPPDYVSTPTQRTTFDGLAEKVDELVAEVQTKLDNGDFNGKDGKDGKDGINGVNGKDGKDGANGKDGINGVDGFSPRVDIDVISGGHKIVIVDAEGEHSFNVLNGKDGAKGDKGAQGIPGDKGDKGETGADGFSPSAKVERTASGAKITITDKNGTTEANVFDGQGGSGGGNVDDVQINGVSILDENKVANIPYGTNSIRGLTMGGNGLTFDSGIPVGVIYDKATYKSKNNVVLISKGTLENRLEPIEKELSDHDEKIDALEDDSATIKDDFTNLETTVSNYLAITKKYVLSKATEISAFHFVEYAFEKDKKYTIKISDDSAVAPIVRLKKEKTGSNIQILGKINIGESITFVAVDDLSWVSLYFEPFLTGAETTTLEITNESYLDNKLNDIDNNIEYLNSVVSAEHTPEFYGAIGDGETDDTTAISTMLNAGLDYYVFNQKYKISGLDVPNRDIKLCGNGTIIVTGLGLIFNAPTKHKEIKDLSFIMEPSATYAIRTDGKPEDIGICSLKIDNVKIFAPQMSNKIGLYLQGETSALLSNINLEGCGMRVMNCTNPTLTNGVIMYTQTAIYNAFYNDGHGTTEPYACGLNIHGCTVVGNTIGLKVVCVDSIIVSESMFDFNDNPVVILGTEEPKLLSSYFSSRLGNPVVWMDKNNGDSGVYGGNGLSSEEMHFVSIQDCVFIQYNESLNYPSIHIGNCEWSDIRSINVMYAGKAGIELNNARNTIIDGFICNTKISGSKCLVSYDSTGSLGDDSKNYYTNFITSLPIYTKFARTNLNCPSYKTQVSGTSVIAATTTSKTFENVIPQGVDYAFVCSNDGTKLTYQESGSNLTIRASTHTDPIRINYIAYGKTTYANWS